MKTLLRRAVFAATVLINATLLADPIPVEVVTSDKTTVTATLNSDQAAALFSMFDLSPAAGKRFTNGYLSATRDGGIVLQAQFVPLPSPTPTPTPTPTPEPPLEFPTPPPSPAP